MTTLPTWSVVLLTLAGPLVALVAIVAAELRERNRQKFEHETKLREDRLKAYSSLARMTKSVNPEQPYELKDLAEAYSEVELLTESPEVLQAAASLYGAAFNARKVARAAWEAGKRPPERRDQLVRDYIRRSQEKRDVFLESARLELGLSPSSTPLHQARVSVRELLAAQDEENHQHS